MVLLIIWALFIEVTYGKEYSEKCGDYTPVNVLLTKYKPCDGGWCLRRTAKF